MPNIRVLGFKQLSHVTKDGETVFRDWVTYAPSHAPQSTVNEDLVERLRPRDEYRGDLEGLKAIAMRARWSEIEPAYLAWKQGHEIPVGGTPLATWPGVTEDQANILRMSAIRTVEDVANMTDTQLTRIQLPNVREMREQAKRFLGSLDAHKAAEQMRQRDEEIATLKKMMAEVLAAQSAPTPVADAPRRGRPPKSAVADALEAPAFDEASEAA